MKASDVSVIKWLMSDDVSALTIWAMDHPDLLIEIGSWMESALTLACVANASGCVNSLLLRGFVPDEDAVAGAVQTGDAALIRKVDNAADASYSPFPPFQTALLTERLAVAAFIERKRPELTIWHKALVDRIPCEELSAAIAFGELAALETIPDLLVVYQKQCQVNRSATGAAAAETLIGQYLGSRRPETIREVRLLGNVEVWERHDVTAESLSDAPALWDGIELVDFSGSLLCSIGESSFIHSGNLVRVILPDTVTMIGGSAFRECGSLKVVKFGSGLKTLGKEAFFRCSSLVEFVLLDTITEIREYAFCGCMSLSVVRLGNRLVKVGSHVFANCPLLEIVLPDTLRKVEMCMFGYCTSLKVAKLGNAVETLGAYALCGCESLVEIVLPEAVTKIRIGAFHGCISLKIAKIGNRVKSLGSYAFQDCRSLIEIVLPDTVTKIGTDTFNGCGSLKTLSLGKVAGSLDRVKWLVPGSTEVLMRG
jgi:hypothetical protein